MYLELFKLHELPFRLSPDPQFLYLSKHHARAKAYMESTIWFTDGFVVITGEIGSGKTTLIETFLRELEKDVVVAQVSQTQVSSIDFLQAVLVQFGFQPFKMKKAEVLSTLNNFLIEQYAAGRKVLLIVDEAQNLSNKVLEEIRMLSGVETTKEKVLRIILAGQPELIEKLNSPELVQLAQRVRLRFHLTPLSESDTRAYIQHRLEVSGSQGRTIFEADTFPLIYRYTGGTPRLINTLCDTAMMIAFAENKDTAGVKELRAAIDELQWTEFGSRPSGASLSQAAAPDEDDEELLPERNTGNGSVPPSRAPHAQQANSAEADPGPVVARALIAQNGERAQELELRPGRLIIGRTADNDVQIESKFISRHHCQIVTTLDSCVIEDLNSTNGIYVKAKRVRKHNLNDGDVVTVGKHELMYVDERAKNRSGIEAMDASRLAQPGGKSQGE